MGSSLVSVGLQLVLVWAVAKLASSNAAPAAHIGLMKCIMPGTDCDLAVSGIAVDYMSGQKTQCKHTDTEHRTQTQTHTHTQAVRPEDGLAAT